MDAKLKFGKYIIELSNTEKVFFPDEGYTKGDVVNYYKDISDYMIPHLMNRPLVMLRYPDGIKGGNFFHKDTPDYFPDWIKTEPVKKEEGGIVNHMICNNAATLVYIANQGCITPHIWLSTTNSLKYPDTLIFDLDPSSDDFGEVVFAAFKLRELLEDELSTRTFIKTTGSKGVHVEVPLMKKEDFDNVRKFGQIVARILAGRYPEKLTTEVRKNKRKGRLFLDVARNAYAQTAVAPYAIRALPGAPVATPIDWDELKDIKSSQKYNIKNIFRRLSQIQDTWKDYRKHAVTIRERSEKAKLLIKENKK